MTMLGKVAIVTGGGTGLGAAVALGLAARGANVLVNYSRSSADAEATAAACRALGVEAAAARGDVGDDADCRALVADAVARWGRLDILINNAGITKMVGHDDLDGLSADDFLSIYRINVVGAFQMIRAAAPAMAASGSQGVVVNVASIAGIMAIGSSVAYAASKAALINMTKSLARALGPGLRINAVCPGFIGTRWFADPMGEAGLAKMIAQQEQSTPLAHAGTAEDIAHTVLFLAGSESGNITGESIITDAGAHLGPRTGPPRKPAPDQ